MPAAPPILTPAERRLRIAAVLIVLFLSALDQTIVSTAMPRIIAELSGLERIAWVGTSYLLTATVMVPIYGKLGDLYGRRPILLFGVVTFLLGSMLCGLAGEFGSLPLIGDGMNQLIVCRGLQGLGAGALTTGAFATVADIAPPAERGKYVGWFGAMFGLASIGGPVIGGALTDHATTAFFGHMVSGWRFVFYVNLPLGAVTLWVLLTHFPAGVRGDKKRIDWLGSALIVASFVPLLLALSWGGHGEGWAAPRVIWGFVAAAVGMAAFLRVSWRNPDAVVPLDLFADPVIGRSNIALFLVNLGFTGLVMFWPLYIQIVRGAGATDSGLAMLPLMGGVLTGSMISGQLARKTQQYKPVLIIGGLVTLLGIALMLGVTRDTPTWSMLMRMALVGFGLGPAQGMFTLAIQSAVPHAKVGVATASAQFFRQIGSTVGVAIFGALLTMQLASELPRRAPELTNASAPFDLSQAQRLAMDRPALAAELARRGVTDSNAPARVQRGLSDSFGSAIEGLFPVTLGLMLIAFLVTLAVPARKLRGRGDTPMQQAEQNAGAAAGAAA